MAARKKTPRKKTPAKKKAAARKSAAKKPAAKKAPAKKPAAQKRGARKTTAARAVFSFGDGRADGRAEMRDLLGGKGANLAEMTRLGIPVPPGFTISTDVCARFNAGGRKLPRDVWSQAQKALARVEKSMGAGFGDAANPLLVSVRSGARASMPGMMDTILNLGLNERTVQGLARNADHRFAWDSYRRFIQMYGNVVLGVPHERFEEHLEDLKRARNVRLDTELGSEDLRGLVDTYLETVEALTGRAFPQDPTVQLRGAISAVFDSWQNDRARRYRQMNRIPEAWGTAVNVQAMVFGNMGDDCATGVAFTRNPSTGERTFYGEWLKNAQGEDVVAGIRTPQPIDDENRTPAQKDLPTLHAEMPGPYAELVRIYKRLERHYRDMQDIEFTIQRGRLWMLQTRAGKRTVRAAVRIAVDMAKERLITRDEALQRVDPGLLEQLLHPTLDPAADRDVLAKGLPASPGAATGIIVLSADEAEMRGKAGQKVILVRMETSPDDIHGMEAAEGILTARGGMTSHAAVVARGMGRCCVAGCGDLRVDREAGVVQIGGHTLAAGDPLTIDGSSGEVIAGSVATVTPELDAEFAELMRWADRRRVLRVRTNADTPNDARVARQFGAEGIGLCRTEHMFFEADRILAVREMILAADAAQRGAALAKLLPMQRSDFVGIFEAMDGLPVTIRLLDPPLHEFLPQTDQEMAEVAAALRLSAGEVRARIDGLKEFNPMLGHRGCRLGITFPEIYRMQVRAIAEASCDVVANGTRVRPELMIPLVAHVGELERLRALCEDEIRTVQAERGQRFRAAIGTMIEVPRAALVAGSIAHHADFFSFGTNDLTQMTYALSRDDAGKFLPEYMDRGILEDDPFVSIDEEGIGELVRIGVENGRATRPDLKVGICGEHGGDAQSVAFCARIGLDYASCSPYRVPVARLAAAQAAIAAEPAGPGRGRKKPQPARKKPAARKKATGRKASGGKTRR
ncbi:MAG: pyruvate, phosphate dikinase [Myxococcales bacterium]|nr:pyruvate, phosphate dikinase [Myxococcales bacterium]